MKWKRSRPRVTGVSLPVFGGGVDWSPNPREKDVVRGLVIELQARRALFAQIEYEDEVYVNKSILEVRERLSEALKALADDSEAYRLIEHMRAACNTYLSVARDPISGSTRAFRPHFQVALQALRESFRVTLAYIGQHGDLPQASDLARDIPADVRMENPNGTPVRVIYIAPPPEIPFPRQGRPDQEQK